MGNIKIYQSISKDNFNGSISKNAISLRSDGSFFILHEFFISWTVPASSHLDRFLEPR